VQNINFQQPIEYFPKDSKIEYINQVLASKKTELTPCIFSEHSRIKVEINTKKKYRNTWRLNNALLSDPWNVKKKEKFLKILKTNENGITAYPTQG
jgi:hypothetical protein